MKKITAFFIAIMMLASIASAIPAAADGAFADVGTDRWSAGSIAYAVEKGYMQGVGGGKFDPEGTLTRAMVVTVLWRMSGSPEVAYKRAFSDVPAEEWFSLPVIWAKDSGVVNGVTVTSFDPEGAITREQLSAMLARYAAYLKFETVASGSIDAYPDAASVSDWATDAMLWAVGEGLITGSLEGGKTLLIPGGLATREQFAAILERFDKARENFSYILEYNHPVLMTSYT
jgi:hypothetical protein